MKSGLGNLKLSIYCCCGYGAGSFVGAQGAIWVAEQLGITGEGITPTPEGPALESVEVSCDDFIKNQHISKTAEVAVVQMFGVILCSNP